MPEQRNISSLLNNLNSNTQISFRMSIRLAAVRPGLLPYKNTARQLKASLTFLPNFSISILCLTSFLLAWPRLLIYHLLDSVHFILMRLVNKCAFPILSRKTAYQMLLHNNTSPSDLTCSFRNIEILDSVPHTVGLRRQKSLKKAKGALKTQLIAVINHMRNPMVSPSMNPTGR